MNVALTAERSQSTSLSMPDVRILRALDALRQRVFIVQRRTWLISASGTSIVLLVALGVTQGWGLSGYVGVFGFSVLTNAILFLPSGRGAVMVAGAMVLNPLAVAVLTGIGGAIGELTGYALGRSTRKLVKHGKMRIQLIRIRLLCLFHPIKHLL